MTKLILTALAVALGSPHYETPWYAGDLAVRLIACDYQVECRDSICAVKWACPWEE